MQRPRPGSNRPAATTAPPQQPPPTVVTTPTHICHAGGGVGAGKEGGLGQAAAGDQQVDARVDTAQQEVADEGNVLAPRRLCACRMRGGEGRGEGGRRTGGIERLGRPRGAVRAARRTRCC